MAEPKAITAPATAESEGGHLLIWLDDHHHHHPHEGGHEHRPHGRLSFVGTYTTPATVDEPRLEAKGTLTFEFKEKFVPGDNGKFKVTKKKDGAEYDVEVVITYQKKAGSVIIEVDAEFKGKGDLRVGEGVGEWKWIKRDEKK